MADRDKVRTVGRRKRAVARVHLTPGKGEWKVNGRPLEDYFPRPTHRIRIAEPLQVTGTAGLYDVTVRVRGGGLSGQSDAVRLGLARALVQKDAEHRGPLREHGLLTRDARKVERKKPGRPKARKRFQFSKR
ncbi:MAG TPA: 30S ribosomal protein S9 [Longimicrobiales bacterium]|nr:30S ribosomal protein S9 [Longimicrobiales bacterium]